MCDGAWLPYYSFWKRTGLTPLSFLFFPEGGRLAFYPCTVPFMCQHMVRCQGGMIREPGFPVASVCTQVSTRF